MYLFIKIKTPLIRMINMNTKIFYISLILLTNLLQAQTNNQKYVLKKNITGELTPKSVIYAGNGLYFTQNMMYKHTIQVYDSLYNLIASINDEITPSDYGYEDIKGTVKGAPVEAAATLNGKYVWVSNYSMTGKNFTKPGCDACCCNGYDESFIYKINTQTFTIDNIIKVGSVPKYLAISPNQKLLLVSNWSSGDVSIIDLNSEKEIKRVKVGRQPRGIAFSADGNIAYIAVMGANYIAKINLQNFECEQFIAVGKNPRHLCIDENYLYVSLNGEQNIARIHLENLSIDKIKVGTMPRSMIIAPHSQKLLINCYGDAKISVVNTRSFTLETTFNTHKNPIGIALSPDETEIWVACYSGSIQVFNNPKPNEPGLLAGINEIKNEMLNMFENTMSTITKNTNNHPDNTNDTSLGKMLSQSFVSNNNLPETTITTLNKTQGYYIILGSFKIKENAYKLKKQLTGKGLDTKVIATEKGYTYCAVGIYPDKKQAQEQIPGIEQKSGIKGWIYYQN